MFIARMSQKGAIGKIYRHAFRRRRKNMIASNDATSEALISIISQEKQPSVLFSNEFDDITCEVNSI